MLRLIFLAALAGLSRASDVVDFTDDDFESKIGDHPMILVEFFAPWCGHCKRLAPEYEAAATRLKGIVSVAKVDCTTSSNTCSKYGVSGYPTLKIFRDGEDSGPYDGPRTADGIVSFLKKQAGPASGELKDEADMEKFGSGPEAFVVGFFADDKSTSQAEFLKAASALRDNYRFAHTNSESLLQSHGIDGEGVVLFRPPRLSSKFEDSSVKFTEDKFTSNKIKRFIQDNIFGICPHMTDDNKDQLKANDLMVAYYDVDYEKNPKGSNYWRNRVMKVAKSFLDQGKKLNFAVANKNLFSHDVSEFGLDGSSGELPLVAIRTAKGDKFVMTEEFSRDGKALQSFLQDYFDGTMKRYLKSEPIPENNDGPVKVLVAENFDDIVNDDSKDVLIEFYAPWCGHCKTLEPKYVELGEKLADDPNVVIAKMDATANDVPSPYEVSGFPTIYFSPAGHKMTPKKYEGGRDVGDFLSYLKKEASNPLVMQEEPKKKKKKKDDDDKIEL
ncbi:protein disulfide-isomerase A3 [Hippoglossus hippoglossus]|uniref:protein disulfide-isomerase A3 n=1 Tax=Hippoglossus hippoglossus TaxID=8267 RepID=UPI00148B3951|nr:protein disulfide-isomerase A3 [Hippoglossus hippoglossus]XP_035012335.1 protein disulfide-isomerase A3 [Hippoglossus stenolepis]